MKNSPIFLNKTIPVTSLQNQIASGVIAGISIFLILIVFQPFGTFGYEMKYKTVFLAGYGIICSAVYGTYYTLLMLIFKTWFSPSKWSFIKELATLIPAILLLSVVSLFYHHAVIGGYTIEIGQIIYFAKISIAVALVPFSLLMYRKWLKSKLTTIQSELNNSESIITFESNNKKEKSVRTSTAELIYIKSNGNYIEIAIYRQENILKYLLRNSLNQVEGILPEDHFIKIHRSYIANKNFFEKLQLAGSSYTVKIKNTKLEIPVSRSMVKNVREMI